MDERGVRGRKDSVHGDSADETPLLSLYSSHPLTDPTPVSALSWESSDRGRLGTGWREEPDEIRDTWEWTRGERLVGRRGTPRLRTGVGKRTERGRVGSESRGSSGGVDTPRVNQRHRCVDTKSELFTKHPM